jgi:hypothetical protein
MRLLIPCSIHPCPQNNSLILTTSFWVYWLRVWKYCLIVIKASSLAQSFTFPSSFKQCCKLNGHCLFNSWHADWHTESMIFHRQHHRNLEISQFVIETFGESSITEDHHKIFWYWWNNTKWTSSSYSLSKYRFIIEIWSNLFIAIMDKSESGLWVKIRADWIRLVGWSDDRMKECDWKTKMFYKMKKGICQL